MAFNNETSVSANKRNLKRMNRLHDNGKFSSFDNAGFEEDSDKSINKDGNSALFSVEETYPQNERNRKYDENQSTTSRRRLPADTNAPQLKQNTVVENIELQVKNDNSVQQQENRTVLGPINNTDASSNKQNMEVKDNDSDVTDSKNSKVSKMTFNVNLKRFENAATSNNTTNATDSQDRLKLTRQTLTEDLSTNRRGSADVFGTALAVARFSRTSSMRVPGRKRPPRLLRDLSLSDADDSDTKDYGTLKNINLPRRSEIGPPSACPVEILDSLKHEFAILNFELSNFDRRLSSLPELESSDIDGILDTLMHELNLITFDMLTLEPILSSFIGPLKVETVASLESLIHELIKRGKIYQAAILDLDESEVLATVPSGMLTKTDALGMTKSLIGQSSLFRLQVGNVDYSCFKHRQDAVQCRAEDLVMVMQMTKTCVVAGFSKDDSPGSCNSEVNEFAKVLEDAGW